MSYKEQYSAFPAETIAKWDQNKVAIDAANKILRDAGLPGYTDLNNAAKDMMQAVYEQDGYKNAVILTNSENLRAMSHIITLGTDKKKRHVPLFLLTIHGNDLPLWLRIRNIIFFTKIFKYFSSILFSFYNQRLITAPSLNTFFQCKKISYIRVAI
jgi:hypothetical protein